MTALVANTQEFSVDLTECRLDQYRLDQYLAALDTGLTRSRLHQLIVEGEVLVNGLVVKPAKKVRSGDRIKLNVPLPRTSEIVPQDIPITVVYQDKSMVVIDKPAGLAVHPGPGHPDQTLVNALLAMCPDIQGIGGEIRPGIVHRLDKDTSGLMMVAKTETAHYRLSAQINDRLVTKGYTALVEGLPDDAEGKVDAPVGRHPRNRKKMAVVEGGREARTAYRVLERFSHSALLNLYLETGRTHQIRVHMAHIGHPLVGDRAYGKRSPVVDRHFLHAHHLAFRHPETGETLEFRTGLPTELQAPLDQLRTGASPA